MTEQLAPIEPTNKRERELRDRAVRDYAALTAIGLDTSRTFFAPGTEATIARKAGTIAKKRKAFEELPVDGLEALADTVYAEDRQDVQVRIGGYTSSEPDQPHLVPGIRGGWYTSRSGGPVLADLAPTEHAWNQFIGKRPAGHAAPGPDVNAWLPDVPAHDAVLRTRKLPAIRERAYGPSYRECFAVVSPGYKAYDLDAAANDLRRIAPSGSRHRVRYDGQRATVDVVLQNPFYLDGGDAAGVGETHRVILRMRTADDGSGGYHLSLLAERVRCINLTLLHAKRSLFHGTHRSDNLRDLAQQALADIEPAMEAFAATWRGAWQDYWVDKYTKAALDGEEAIRRIVGHGKYRIPGLGEEGTLDACLAALREEPGDSRAHVHNALTAAAHHAPTTWASRWADETAEEQASQMLYQTVRWLPEVEA